MGAQSGQICLLAEAKDLGVAMRYRNSRVLGLLNRRLHEGQRRWARLSTQPRSIANKGRLIQSLIWPAAFYGCEGFAVGRKHIHTLRSAAARAIAGPYQQIAPFLALASLLPNFQDPEPEVYVMVAALRLAAGLAGEPSSRQIHFGRPCGGYWRGTPRSWPRYCVGRTSQT